MARLLSGDASYDHAEGPPDRNRWRRDVRRYGLLAYRARNPRWEILEWTTTIFLEFRSRWIGNGCCQRASRMADYQNDGHQKVPAV